MSEAALPAELVLLYASIALELVANGPLTQIVRIVAEERRLAAGSPHPDWLEWIKRENFGPGRAAASRLRANDTHWDMNTLGQVLQKLLQPVLLKSPALMQLPHEEQQRLQNAIRTIATSRQYIAHLFPFPSIVEMNNAIGSAVVALEAQAAGGGECPLVPALAAATGTSAPKQADGAASSRPPARQNTCPSLTKRARSTRSHSTSERPSDQA